MTPKHRTGVTVYLPCLVGAFLVGGDPRSPSTTRAVAQDSRADSQVQERKLSHEETLAWIAEHRAWRRAKKTKPIWARAVEADEVGKGFQTADRAVEKARTGYWLSVGVAGEPWFQTREKIDAKYEPAGVEIRRFAFDSRPRKYVVFKPRSETRNWVARVKGPGIVGFFVRPNYDPAHPLYSPAGGYVVRDDVPDPYRGRPDDVWLVQQALFESTYALVP